MATKELTIYNSYTWEYDHDEVRKEVAEIREKAEDEVTDEEIWDEIHFQVESWYESEQDMLSKQLDGRVIAIADIGLWNGRRRGYKVLEDNLNEILWCDSNCDYLKVTYDRHGVHAKMSHHDGTHYVDYRMLREDKNVDLFLDKLYNGTATDNDIKNYTKSLRPYIKDIYGW